VGEKALRCDTVCQPRTLTADRGDARRRLDLVVRRHLTDISAATRTRVQAWIEAGLVAVNGTTIRRTSTRAAFGDVITVALPDAVHQRSLAGDDTPLNILFEDDDLLAINKPAGIVVHPTFRHASGTMMNALVGYARRWPAGQRPSLVGRLDKETSGLLLVAKTAATHAALQRTVIEKDYLALVHGRVNAARGEIAAALNIDPSDRRRMTSTAAGAGAASLTFFERLGRVRAPGPAVSLLRCRLGTGRRHQIRVHLASRGWPIVGDPVYRAGRPAPAAPTADPALAAALLAFPRQALHAWRTAFPHPATGRRILIEAALPADLRELLRVSGLGSVRSVRL
jgi:23S rRNA pseudouridine1911/1915/1917 synthase